MADSTSPLHTINQKELELRRRIEEAHRQAEELLQAAHAEAEQIVAQADQDARAAAEARYQQGIEAAQAEAEALITKATEQATALHQQATANLDRAVRRIIEMVLPSGSFLAEEAEEEIIKISDLSRSH